MDSPNQQTASSEALALFSDNEPAIVKLPGMAPKSAQASGSNTSSVVASNKAKQKDESKAASKSASKEQEPQPESREIIAPANLLSYSQLVGRSTSGSSASASDGIANLFSVPRRRPEIINLPSPDHASYPLLEEARTLVSASKKMRRHCSSATARAAVVRSDPVVPDIVLEASRGSPTEHVTPNDNQPEQTAKGIHDTVVVGESPQTKPSQSGEESHGHGQPKKKIPMITVQDVERELMKDKQPQHNSPGHEVSDSGDGSDMTAKLMAKLARDISRPQSASSILVASSRHQPFALRPEPTSFTTPHSPAEHLLQPPPETVTYFRPKPKTSCLGHVPVSAQLVSHATTTTSSEDQNIASNTPVLSAFSSSSSSLVPPPPQEQSQLQQVTPIENSSLPLYSRPLLFRYQAQISNNSIALSNNSASNQPRLPLYQRRRMSRRNRNQLVPAQTNSNDIVQGIVMGSNLSPTRQGSLATRQHPEIVNPAHIIPSMHGHIGNLAIPGAPSYGDFQLSATQAEEQQQQQRIAAIWRDQPAAPYSPSVYSRSIGGTTFAMRRASENASQPRSPTGFVPIGFAPERPQADNAAENRVPRAEANGDDTINTSTTTTAPLAFSDINNLMSLLTDHIVQQTNQARDAVLASVLRHLDALSMELHHLQVQQQNLTRILEQQGNVLARQTVLFEQHAHMLGHVGQRLNTLNGALQGESRETARRLDEAEGRLTAAVREAVASLRGEAMTTSTDGRQTSAQSPPIIGAVERRGSSPSPRLARRRRAAAPTDPAPAPAAAPTTTTAAGLAPNASRAGRMAAAVVAAGEEAAVSAPPPPPKDERSPPGARARATAFVGPPSTSAAPAAIRPEPVVPRGHWYHLAYPAADN
ncbi:hypothetical protein VTO42DRAFT_3116 [Malbranchea cinnamomea]